MLACKRCGDDKPVSEFGVRADRPLGRSSVCRGCRNLADRERYADNLAEGRRVSRAKRALYLKRNKSKVLVQKRRFYEAHRNEALAYAKAYARRHPEVINARAMRRNAAKRRAVPPWATGELDAFVVSEMYALRELRTATTGFEWHVDHVVPLTSDAVCGLHCASNLRVIPAAENIRKQNRVWPDK